MKSNRALWRPLIDCLNWSFYKRAFSKEHGAPKTVWQKQKNTIEPKHGSRFKMFQVQIKILADLCKFELWNRDS